MSEPIANFCPLCGASTEMRPHDGRTRPQCTQCGRIIYFDPKVAAIAFIERGDEILLIQRGIEPGLGLWALPGGFVEYREHPEAAAMREVLEETSLHIAIGDLLGVFHTSNSMTITIAYRATLLNGEPIPADDVQAVRWFTRESLPELVFISTITLLDRWRRGAL